MSDYDEELDSSNVICPYCKHEYQPEPEDFDEDESVEECSNCHKKFHHHDEITYDYHTRPDCELNDEEHKWELNEHTNHDFCEVCGIIRPFNDEQRKKIKEDYDRYKISK